MRNLALLVLLISATWSSASTASPNTIPTPDEARDEFGTARLQSALSSARTHHFKVEYDGGYTIITDTRGSTVEGVPAVASYEMFDQNSRLVVRGFYFRGSSPEI